VRIRLRGRRLLRLGHLGAQPLQLLVERGLWAAGAGSRVLRPLCPSLPTRSQTAEQLLRVKACLQSATNASSRPAGPQVHARRGAEAAARRGGQGEAGGDRAADTHDYSEAETRDYFIDLLLKEAGWPLDQPRDREFEVAGMPNNQGKGFVDYVLWGDDGNRWGSSSQAYPARFSRRPAAGQALRDCLERQFGQRPLIFYSNGYEHWLWDDTNYRARGAGLLTRRRSWSSRSSAAAHASRWRRAR